MFSTPPTAKKFVPSLCLLQVSYTLRLLLNKRRGGGSRPGPTPADMLRDTLRWGAFLGSFAGGYVLFDEAIALLGGTER
jgi:hypothetical protein